MIRNGATNETLISSFSFVKRKNPKIFGFSPSYFDIFQPLG